MAPSRRGHKPQAATSTAQHACRPSRQRPRAARYGPRPRPAAALSSATGRDTPRTDNVRPASRPSDSAEDGDGHLSDDDALPPGNSEVVMALEMLSNGIVGCAYFVAATATLYLQEETRVTGLELVESLLFQAQPTAVIVPSRAPQSLADFLHRQSNNEGLVGVSENDAQGHGGFMLCTVVSSDFSHESGRHALSRYDGLDIHQHRSALVTTAIEDSEEYVLHGDDGEQRGVGARERNRLMRLGTVVNLDSRVTLGCAGALIRDLERRQEAAAAAAVAVDTELFQIRSVQTVTYDKCMFVTADTLLALQIFRPDLRQGSGKATAAESRGKGARDKQAIFDLFHSFALTSQGRARLREIFVRPSTDLAVIETRHQSIASLLHPDNQVAVASIRAALKRTKNMRPLLLHLRQGLFLPGSFSSIRQGIWAHLLDFCTSVLQIFDVGSQTLHGGCYVIGKALDSIDTEALLRAKEALTQQVGFRESRSSGRSAIASGVDSELDALKSAYSSLQARLGNVCEMYRAQLPVEARADIVGCIFHPEKGYLLVAAATLQMHDGSRSRRSSSVPGEAHVFENWAEEMREDGLVYYKMAELGDIDTDFGDLAGQIIEREVEIFHALGSAILDEEAALGLASDAVGEVDSILALANGADALHLSRPRMTTRNVLHIRKGRHLLQELGPGTFVPNSCFLAGGLGSSDGDESEDEEPKMPGTDEAAPNTIVVTGPNHSGKSVYLKQVATILFLAHVGSFVPAEGALVGITDKILTRIATRESVSRDESAFGVDLRQAAFSINFATRRSLVLIDEFGKGTAVVDGAALIDALLDHFLRLGNDSPKVIAATHFLEIFDIGAFERHPRLSLAHMSITVDPGASRPEDKVQFLHRLRQGRGTESFGYHCAAINGVAPSVVERAGQLGRLLSLGIGLEKICLQRRAEDAERLKANEGHARRFLAEMAEALDSGSTWRAPRDMLRLVFDEECGTPRDA